MSNPTKYYSSIQEKSISKYLGWNTVSGSGARDCHPGDIISDAWIGECKTHVTPGSPVKLDCNVWKKIVEEATSKFKYPVLFVDDGSQKIENTWVLFRYRSTCPPGKKLVANFPLKVGKHITFGNTVLKEKYLELCRENPDTFVIYSVGFSGEILGLVSLEMFQKMFGENS